MNNALQLVNNVQIINVNNANKDIQLLNILKINIQDIAYLVKQGVVFSKNKKKFKQIIQNNNQRCEQSGKCIQCDDSFYLKKQTCLLCEIQYCKKCQKETGICQKCLPEYDLKDGKCINKDNKCIDYPNYCYDNKQEQCLRCKNICIYCTQIGNYLQCEEQHQLSQQYKECIQCQQNCWQCTQQQCLKCNQNFELQNQQCVKIVDFCGEGEFFDGHSCSFCPSNCLKCSDYNTCLECYDELNFVLITQDQRAFCKEKCDQNQYVPLENQEFIFMTKGLPVKMENERTLDCKQCNNQQNQCLQCSGLSDFCIQCQPGLYLFQGTCYKDKCPPDTYKEEGQFICKKCFQSTQQLKSKFDNCIKQDDILENNLFVLNDFVLQQCPWSTVEQYNNCLPLNDCESIIYNPNINNAWCTQCKQKSQFSYFGQCLDKCPEETTLINGNCIQKEFYNQKQKFENSQMHDILFNGFYLTTKSLKDVKIISEQIIQLIGNFKQVDLEIEQDINFDKQDLRKNKVNNQCDSNFCSNKGICKKFFSSYFEMCDCSSDFTGIFQFEQFLYQYYLYKRIVLLNFQEKHRRLSKFAYVLYRFFNLRIQLFLKKIAQ
ncbi:hypothetical protein IMG5_061000 [Ichthyophthirius multifiliis]|uniref:Uncharacterized protein n=1 Tax=Ichthyophthirius multifiliis TaxID=5932 RepID=G0QNR9_ICHMU|nr:hypothetical protein IMG5_061000 [Ichthyophthirius multifiliis]EGR33149.1 hypothetical protein IMG5_061000 [Ichthyophthirius multifiliis]|eukprot:XP_004037135.1 hypothetical protein IMG5_061000 [Ichthyophthirius multifiliis]